MAFTLKECRLRSAPGFDFRLEQRYCVLFRHRQSIFVPSMVALQLGAIRCKTTLKCSSRQRTGKVFGNNTVSSHIYILLQKVSLTYKRADCDLQKLVDFNHKNRNQQNAPVWGRNLWLSITDLLRVSAHLDNYKGAFRSIKSVQKFILSFLVRLLLPTHFWCRELLLGLNTPNNTHIHTW